MGQTQFFQQTWQAQVAHAVALPAGLVGQGAGQPGFTDTGGAADDQVEAVAQPLTTAQLQDQRLIQSARAAVVDVFEAGVVLEPGLAQAAAQALVIAFGQLAVDQQAEAFFEAQAVDVRGFQLFIQRLEHAVQAQGLQLVQGRMGQHGEFPWGQW
ncbi:hypothetical protein PSOLE_46950 [Pseudomonas oleovorans subsp. oleovorans]|nr:hypothetical protein PSOLE_46950 [Pseudomonas oleovorans subsp. oleovorans]